MSIDYAGITRCDTSFVGLVRRVFAVTRRFSDARWDCVGLRGEAANPTYGVLVSGYGW